MFDYLNFHRLPVWSQVAELERQGTLLAQRKHLEFTITLYSLDNFFVEVWSLGSLRISTSFRKTTKPVAILEPYLVNVMLPDFF